MTHNGKWLEVCDKQKHQLINSSHPSIFYHLSRSGQWWHKTFIEGSIFPTTSSISLRLWPLPGSLVVFESVQNTFTKPWLYIEIEKENQPLVQLNLVVIQGVCLLVRAERSHRSKNGDSWKTKLEPLKMHATHQNGGYVPILSWNVDSDTDGWNWKVLYV